MTKTILTVFFPDTVYWWNCRWTISRGWLEWRPTNSWLCRRKWP